MSINIPEIINAINWAFLAFGCTIIIVYILIAFFSYREIKHYKKKHNFDDENILLQSTNLPSISILAPAYNEELNVIANVNSLLTLNYPSFEIIIINDGSKDDTLTRLIETFDMIPDNKSYYDHIKTKKIRCVYVSKKNSLKRLKVIDKVNGGKADALNSGINVCSSKTICCIDVDCVLERNSLLKLVKPFLNNDKKVIASGGIIRVANSCTIEDGRIIEVKLPDTFIARAQIVEYFRAFLMGRMAWSRLDGLLLISGAFGMFDRETVIEAGGYNPKTVGEDMELLVRMRKMMRNKRIKYTVGFIPDPLCWTEVPQDWNVLYRQRNRWTRGTIETLIEHRDMLFNPKYKVLGLLSTPFWFFFEWLAPIVEFTGIFFFIFIFFYNGINWAIFTTLMLVIYSFAVLFSITALYFEEYSFQQYKKPKYTFKLIRTAFLDPLIFHPFVMWASIKGNIDFLRGKKAWGNMNRVGLNTKKLSKQK